MSLWTDQTEWPPRSSRVRSIPQAELRLPETVRGRKAQKLSPRRALAGILRGGDADVVAAVVLDEEVAVAALRQRHLAQPLLQVGALVAELVRGVDRDPGDHRHRQREADAVDGREAAVGPHVAGQDQPGVLDRDEDVGAPAVVAVLFEPLDHAVGGVLGVHPDQDVEQREDHEDEERAVEPEDAEPGQRHQPPGDEGQQRDDQPEQPCVALRVGPGGGIQVDFGPVVMVMLVCGCLHAGRHSLSNSRRAYAWLTD